MYSFHQALQARIIFETLPKKEGTFHLSTNMYPKHRRRVLGRINKQLKNKKMCRVVSTSLVEAGVDLDFPVVYRAIAGLDSIAQARGPVVTGKDKCMGKVMFLFLSRKKHRACLGSSAVFQELKRLYVAFLILTLWVLK